MSNTTEAKRDQIMQRIFQRRTGAMGVIGLLAGLLLAIAPGEASAALTGNWGCLGTTIFSFVPGGATQPQTETESQMMRLVVGPTGGVTATILFGVSGDEVCQFNATGSISVNAQGFGLLSLTFNPNVSDEDKDTTFKCGAFFGRTSTITETFHILTEKAGTQFHFIGKDDFITPSTGDNADYFAVSGECLQQ